MALSVDQWVGKLAVVTGASAGIGAAVSKKLLEFGINVAGLARRAENVEALTKDVKNAKGKLYPIKCDITSEEDVKRAFKEISKIGPVHILINNAGRMVHSNLYDGDVEGWRKVLDTNVMGTCIVTKEVIKIMSENNIAGQIINLNSILGHFVYNVPKANIYCASKHALAALTETLRLELSKIGSKIKISSLSPGPIEDTEFFDKKIIGGEGPAMYIEHYLKPEDLVNAILYILSTPPHMHVAELMLRPVGLSE